MPWSWCGFLHLKTSQIGPWKLRKGFLGSTNPPCLHPSLLGCLGWSTWMRSQLSLIRVYVDAMFSTQAPNYSQCHRFSSSPLVFLCLYQKSDGKSSKDLLVSSSANHMSQTLPTLDLSKLLTKNEALERTAHFFAYRPSWFKPYLHCTSTVCQTIRSARAKKALGFKNWHIVCWQIKPTWSARVEKFSCHAVICTYDTLTSRRLRQPRL